MRRKLKEAAGFTLVELIVVIAILGILASVGGVAYAGYVERANKAVDEQLVADVKYALTLAAMEPGNPLSEGGGMVTLTTTDATAGVVGAADADKQAATEAAMADAFGPDWENTLKLKYGDWNAEKLGVYQNSSFHDNEVEMISQVGELTNALSDYLSTLGDMGSGNFSDYMAAHGISGNEAMADAAVAYVAGRNNALTDAERDKFVSAICNIGSNPDDPGASFSTAVNTVMNDVYGGSALPTAAAMYAVMAAMGQYEVETEGTSEINTILADLDFTGVNNENAATASSETLAILGTALGEAMTKAEDAAWLDGYKTTRFEQDVAAYLSLMDMVTDNEDALLENAGNSNMFDGTADDPAKQLVEEYLQNSVYAVPVAEGEIVVAISSIGGNLKAMSTIDLE